MYTSIYATCKALEIRIYFSVHCTWVYVLVGVYASTRLSYLFIHLARCSQACTVVHTHASSIYFIYKLNVNITCTSYTPHSMYVRLSLLSTHPFHLGPCLPSLPTSTIPPPTAPPPSEFPPLSQAYFSSSPHFSWLRRYFPRLPFQSFLLSPNFFLYTLRPYLPSSSFSIPFILLRTSSLSPTSIFPSLPSPHSRYPSSSFLPPPTSSHLLPTSNFHLPFLPFAPTFNFYLPFLLPSSSFPIPFLYLRTSSLPSISILPSSFPPPPLLSPFSRPFPIAYTPDVLNKHREISRGGSC